MAKQKTPFIFGIAGGSCSGKTTLGKKIFEALGGDSMCGLLYQDSYYIDQSARFKEDGGEVNFDHPNALDFDLLAQHLKALKLNQSIQVPIYDFATHKRKKETEDFQPRPIIVLDGTLILTQNHVISACDASIFVDTPEDLRFERRKRRDVQERGRTLEGVIKQFLNHVKPMHDQFVQPSRDKASIIVSNEDSVELLIDRLLNGV